MRFALLLLPVLLLVACTDDDDGPVTTLASLPFVGVVDGVFLEEATAVAPAPLAYPFENTWEILAHQRDTGFETAPNPVMGDHGPNCEPPGEDGSVEHLITTYADTVYGCANHWMTALFAEGYGVIYQTPPALLDISTGGTLSFDVSSQSDTARDWWSVSGQCFDTAILTPLQHFLPDLTGMPPNSFDVAYQPFDFQPMVLRAHDGAANEILTFGNVVAPGTIPMSAVTRWPYKFEISQTSIRITSPDPQAGADIVWMDTALSLPCDEIVVSLVHHSYNPEKDCAPSVACKPNTWHWDNVRIEPAIPVTIIKPDTTHLAGAGESAPIIWTAPAPSDAFVRLAATSGVEVSFDGGAWVAPTVRSGSHPAALGHVESYVADVPAGATSMQVRGASRYEGFYLWSRSTACADCTPEPTPTATPPTFTPTPTPTSTPTPTPPPLCFDAIWRDSGDGTLTLIVGPELACP